MKQETKSLLIKYGVCFSVASLITVSVFAIKGFFTDSPSVNLQILSDGFSLAGLMLLFFAGMMFISGEGGLIGISYIMRSVIQAFIPGGRKHHEVYAKYRERKMEKLKATGDYCALITGSVFLAVGIILTIIWYAKFYNVV